MGTMLYAMGIPLDQSFEGLNLERPELVFDIHRRYVEAGARLLETNTFGANADRLARHGLEARVHAINGAAVQLAKRAAAGRDVFVAGSIGPLSKPATNPEALPPEQRHAIFREQAAALADGGADLLVLETFTTLEDITIAYRAAREATDLPIVAQAAFVERGGSSPGEEPVELLTGLWRLGADVVGTNCGRGPKLILEVMQDFAPHTGVPLSAFFNSGSPDLVDGRYIYLQRPPYLAEVAERLCDLGVNLIGGCCGTTPEMIAAVSERLRSRTLKVRVKKPLPPLPKIEVGIDPVFPPGFIDRPDDQVSIVAELDSPRGLDIDRTLEGARHMREAGIDLVSIAENPLASPRLGNVATAVLMKRYAGIEPLVHFTCRDRNLIGLQSDIMGASALGLQYILCITGDPASVVGEVVSKGVYEVTSLGLVKLVSGLNRGTNAAGVSIRKPTRFRIGVAFNANVKHLHVQVERLVRKVALGAHFTLTQPCWDPQRIEEVLRATRDVPVKLHIGIMPLCSERNAEFLHNEVPGMTVPDEVRRRMKGLSGAAGREMGLRIAEELLDVVARHSGRVYLITPFQHFEMTARLADAFRGRVRARGAAGGR
jgi:homocysteine S-methyltransferase